MTDALDDTLAWDDLVRRAAVDGLWPIGGFEPTPEDDVPIGTRTLVLLAPQDDVFWPLFSQSREYTDGAADPLDRWSRRVIGGIACALRAKALFPFSGPPWRPFIGWAKRTGRVHSSPVGMLIEPSTGLFFSLRGALALKSPVRGLPGAAPSPCAACASKPCLTACPVGALGQGTYKTDCCHSYLKTSSGQACLQRGCAVRRACPVSQAWPRADSQSAFHMAAFHGSV